MNIVYIILGILVIISFIILYHIRKLKFIASIIPLNKKLKTDIPTITLYNNSKPFTFIMDSGSTLSFIAEKYFKDLEILNIGTTNKTTYGLCGESNEEKVCLAQFEDGNINKYYLTLFVNTTMQNTLDHMEHTYKIKIHGLLGTDFLLKNNCCLNFKDLNIYRMK